MAVSSSNSSPALHVILDIVQEILRYYYCHYYCIRFLAVVDAAKILSVFH